MDLRYLVLDQKLQALQKNKELKNLPLNSKYKYDINAWTELQLSTLIVEIFEKYPHDIQNFTALRNIVDFQY